MLLAGITIWFFLIKRSYNNKVLQTGIIKPENHAFFCKCVYWFHIKAMTTIF